MKRFRMSAFDAVSGRFFCCLPCSASGSAAQHLVARADPEGAQRDVQGGAAAVDAERIAVAEGRAPLALEAIDHALRIKPVEAEGAARVDHLVDQALLLLVDVVGAGQFPRQRGAAHRRAAFDCQAVR